MATLHVRNVPEPLYELLRACAEREGRSIGAQAIELLQSALLRHAPLKEDVVSKAVRRRSPFLKRFAESGKDLAVRAQEIARELGAPEVAPAHVLLAMFEDDVLRSSLDAAGLTEEDVRARAPRGDGSPTQIPFSADTKQVLENALRTSLAARHTDVRPEHVMVAAGFPGFEAQPLPPRPGDYLAVDLDGAADAWTARLNELADEGWELLHVHGARAILRRGV